MPKSKTKHREFTDPRVAEIFREYPEKVRAKLLYLRELIYDTAAKTDGVGELEETLRWGEPTYLTTESGSGSMVRVNAKGTEGQYAMYFHCQTGLVPIFRTLYPKKFSFEGKRAILFNQSDVVPVEELTQCISMALTYHQGKNKKNHQNSKTSKRTKKIAFDGLRFP